jgi:ClpP class serine protease
MTPADVLWLFFLFSALQPTLKQQFLEASRRRLIAKIEHERKSRVILLVHRHETMSVLGFPVFRYIDVNDSEEVPRAIHLTDPAAPLDIVLHTPGGLVLASLQIARAIHKHQGNVTAFVPHYAMSGGTLIALAATDYVRNGEDIWSAGPERHPLRLPGSDAPVSTAGPAAHGRISSGTSTL